MKVMKWMNLPGCFGWAVIAACFSPCALAIEPGWYAGFGGGGAYSRIDDNRISQTLLGGGFTTTAYTDDERDLGFKILGGYQFSPYIALEGGYMDLGRYDFNAQTLPAGSLTGEIKIRGLHLDLMGLLPLSARLSAFARLGANHAEARAQFAGTGLVTVPNPDRRERATNIKYGAGLEYEVTRALGLRIEAERYRINDTVGNTGDIDLASAGLIYRFGMQAATPVTSMQAAPAAQRRLRAIPAKVSFSADSLFAYESTTIQPAGKQGLDELARELKTTQYSNITVTGHTDSIGSETYNLELSEQRAAAVKLYLMETAGIPASKISSRGVGASQPVTRPGDCAPAESGEARVKRIACMQPDRRVEVDVSGTQ